MRLASPGQLRPRSAASTLLDALAERGLDNVITVSEQEAADALATGIADRGGYASVAVCIVDPDDALVALVDADGVTTERVDPTVDDVTAVLAGSDVHPRRSSCSVRPTTSMASRRPSTVSAAPVITAADADLALARGTALASARAVNILERGQPMALAVEDRCVDFRRCRRGRGLRRLAVRRAGPIGLTPDTNSTVAQRDTAATADQPARVPAAPSVAQAAPQPVPAAPPPRRRHHPRRLRHFLPTRSLRPPRPRRKRRQWSSHPRRRRLRRRMFLRPHVPPTPNYVPPVPQQPRLRDRIIERIPIIGRFHEPQYQ